MTKLLHYFFSLAFSSSPLFFPAPIHYIDLLLFHKCLESLLIIRVRETKKIHNSLGSFNNLISNNFDPQVNSLNCQIFSNVTIYNEISTKTPWKLPKSIVKSLFRSQKKRWKGTMSGNFISFFFPSSFFFFPLLYSFFSFLYSFYLFASIIKSLCLWIHLKQQKKLIKYKYCL